MGHKYTNTHFYKKHEKMILNTTKMINKMILNKNCQNDTKKTNKMILKHEKMIKKKMQTK